MEIIELTKTFREVEGKLKFYRNTLFLKENEQLFYSHTYSHNLRYNQIKIENLSIHAIPTEEIYPPFSPDVSLAPQPLPDRCHVKTPDLLSYKPDAPLGTRPCDTFLEEIRILEILKANPHPNIAQYLGCIIQNYRIKGVVFAKYHMTLVDRLEDISRPLRPEIYLSSIESDLKHLHGLGLVHNDLNPYNVMLREDDTAIIIDFNTCQRQGEKCRSGGAPGWSLEEMDFAVPENDYYGLAKIRQALENGKMLDDDDF
jgi:hypothetical protein